MASFFRGRAVFQDWNLRIQSEFVYARGLNAGFHSAITAQGNNGPNPMDQVKVRDYTQVQIDLARMSFHVIDLLREMKDLDRRLFPNATYDALRQAYFGMQGEVAQTARDHLQRG